MRKYISYAIVLIIALFPSFIYAQEKEDMNLHFVYIDHEVTTPVNDLCKKLRGLQEDATEVDDGLIIYLSDGKTSLFSFTNLKDNFGKNRDTEQAFVEIIAALQDANSHDVNAHEDINNILELFDEYNFIDENGEVTWANVTFDFYVGTSFWALGNNEKVIAHLYESMSLANLPKDKFNINIFKTKSDHLVFQPGLPFGDNNLGGINERVRILEY